MERIEDLVLGGCSAEYKQVHVRGKVIESVWLPSLPLPMYGVRYALADAWAVLWGRATAVQWPHHRNFVSGAGVGRMEQQPIVLTNRAMDTLCAQCRLRPATLDWIGEGGTLAHAHGLYERWCEVCATTEQLAYAKRQADRVPELEAKLATLTADPPSPAGTR